MDSVYSLREAAAIAEVSADALRTAIEKKSVIPSGQTRAGRAKRHGFSEVDVLLVKILSAFPFPLSKRDKHSLARVLSGAKRQGLPWSLRGDDLLYAAGEMQLTVACKAIRKRLKENQATYRWGKRRVVSFPDVLSGEPVFRGTRIPADHVASLFRKGVSEREIAEEFPVLNARDFAYARLLSRMGSKPGRPRQPLLFKKQAKAA